MMKQYMEIKQEHQDCILFFRLGDFYEMFFDDALTASREMEITLTGRDCGQEQRAPMCGVPYHAADNYIAKLIAAGYKVAICEQIEDPSLAKGIVRREVIRIITPGTVLNQAMLSEKENNYLASVYLDDEGAGIAYADISTGEIRMTSVKGSGCLQKAMNEIARINPREIIGNDSIDSLEVSEELGVVTEACRSAKNEAYFKYPEAEEMILTQFHVKALKGLGIEDSSCGVRALGALLKYLYETQKNILAHLTYLRVYDLSGHMALDKAALKNLEITETLFEKKTQGSLLGVLDHTKTAMGGRKIKQWLREPLIDAESIKMRLDAVEVLSGDILMRNNLKENMKKIYDLERLAGRIACGTANGRDLAALKQSVFMLPEIKSDISRSDALLLNDLNAQIDPLQDLFDIIDKGIVEDPPFAIKEGGLIKPGYSQALDDIKFSIIDRQNWIAGLEASEKEKTGIKSLKVGFNKVFGYYIEVTKSYYAMVPEQYIRKQTLANCERFITPELKEAETLVLNAEMKINQLEHELFLEIRSMVQSHIGTIQRTSEAISSLDVLVSFAEAGTRYGYTKPEIDNSDVIDIRKGRHPVIEQSIKNGIFVPNDTYADGGDRSMLLITGPNMAGKSTYMRQNALIVLMAQAGCFVPAESAKIGIVDKVFTRIGASDNLSQGQSTFFIEMSELAFILNTATGKSLIILDEIGRGTSTYDGLSIAWAVVEFLCNNSKRAKTLFATHYHELTQLEGHLKGMRNLNVDVQDSGGNIVFLHKIIEGSASRSYGIHVAQLAGVPSEILDMAEKKLAELERKSVTLTIKADIEKEEKSIRQISFFEPAPPDPVIQKLRSLDLMNITPSQAIGILEELKNALQ